MTPYSPSAIAKLIDGVFTFNVKGTISRLLIDSRSVFDAGETVFFALRGASHDGHDFINDLFRRGVRNFVVERGRIPRELKPEANWIETASPRAALQILAARHRSRFHFPVLAITGSNGKTIVKEWLAQMIGNDLRLIRSPRSYNSQVGVPLSLWQITDDTELAVIEAGISLPGEMEKLAGCIKPTMGMFTTLGQAHQENFGSLQHKLEEKLRLFDEVDTLFYCSDMTQVDETMRSRFPGKKRVTWGRDQSAGLQLLAVEVSRDLTGVNLRWRNEDFRIDFPFTDSVSLENLMHVILFLLNWGYSPKALAGRALQLQPVAMRLEQKTGDNNCLLINDTYNADITSLEVALDFLVQQSRQKGVSRTVVLSDLLQTGIPEEELYPMIARLLDSKNIDRFIGVGPALGRYASLFGKNARFFGSTPELLNALPALSFKDEAVLVKGSRKFAFEQIINVLELKKHATVLEINLNALTHNLNEYRSLLQPRTRVLVVVKAFSYGSGSFEIASALQHQNVDYLGVAFADEGMELRKAGIALPILVLNPDERSFPEMIDYKLEPEIYSFRLLDAFYREVKSEGISDFPIHIKIDTGMNRMGFLPYQTEALIEKLREMPQLSVRSVFSHLAGSEDSRLDDFSREQIDRFNGICNMITTALGISFLKHLVNSAGIERFPEAHFDMVRLGIGLHGFGGGKLDNLQNVMTLKTYVSQIKEVKAEESVGYGRAGLLNKEGQIAVLPIGYADGLNRHLGCGKGQVIIHGKPAPFIGNICMDTCMVDVTDIEVAEGDEVVVFGDAYPLTNLARQLDTIPYEILTSISRRVRRVYFKE